MMNISTICWPGTIRQRSFFRGLLCCGLLIAIVHQSAFADDDCEDDVCISLQTMIGFMTFDFPPDQFEFEVQVTDLPQGQNKVIVFVQLMREIDGEDVLVHRMKLKVKKKGGSDIASRKAFWDPSDTEDKKGKTYRLVAVLKLEEEESLNATEKFNIRWSGE